MAADIVDQEIPSYTLLDKIISNGPQRLSAKDVIRRKTELTDHLLMHWQPDVLGSRFIENDLIKTPLDMLRLLNDCVETFISENENNLEHIISIQLPKRIGVEGIVQMHPDEPYTEELRGDTLVKVVLRPDRLKETDIITFQVKPVYKDAPDGKKHFLRITSAYPGHPVPGNDVNKFWDTHAYVRQGLPVAVKLPTPAKISV